LVLVEVLESDTSFKLQPIDIYKPCSLNGAFYFENTSLHYSVSRLLTLYRDSFIEFPCIAVSIEHTNTYWNVRHKGMVLK